MNHFHAKAEWIEGAWRALVRYSHKSDYHLVMDGRQPAGFPSKAAAELAALRDQERHMNGTITGFGDRVEFAKSEADKLFRLGKKPIAIETIRKPGRKPVTVIPGRARA